MVLWQPPRQISAGVCALLNLPQQKNKNPVRCEFLHFPEMYKNRLNYDPVLLCCFLKQWEEYKTIVLLCPLLLSEQFLLALDRIKIWTSRYCRSGHNSENKINFQEKYWIPHFLLDEMDCFWLLATIIFLYEFLKVKNWWKQ